MAGTRLHVDEVDIDDELLGRLLADQHPQWSTLPIRRVASTGTDQAVFRLGDDLVVRLPRIAWAERQVATESTWLPRLAPHLPVPVPEPVAAGEPGHGYPFAWLVSTWLPGGDLLAAMTGGADLGWESLVDDLAEFLAALQAVDLGEAPTPGKRARALADRDADVRAGIAAMAGEIDASTATAVWDAALTAEPWSRPRVWVHGDLLPGNLVVRDGRLAGVIDWASTGVGDPACELMVAWSLPPDARGRLRSALDVDDATWTRAKGWVVEQAVPFIPYYERTIPDAVAITRHRLAAVLADPS